MSKVCCVLCQHCKLIEKKTIKYKKKRNNQKGFTYNFLIHFFN